MTTECRSPHCHMPHQPGRHLDEFDTVLAYVVQCVVGELGVSPQALDDLERRRHEDPTTLTLYAVATALYNTGYQHALEDTGAARRELVN